MSTALTASINTRIMSTLWQTVSCTEILGLILFWLTDFVSKTAQMWLNYKALRVLSCTAHKPQPRSLSLTSKVGVRSNSRLPSLVNYSGIWGHKNPAANRCKNIPASFSFGIWKDLSVLSALWVRLISWLRRNKRTSMMEWKHVDFRCDSSY